MLYCCLSCAVFTVWYTRCWFSFCNQRNVQCATENSRLRRKSRYQSPILQKQHKL